MRLEGISSSQFLDIFIYTQNKNEENLSRYQQSAQTSHVKFNNIIGDILEMKKEKVQGRLLDLIKRLKNASNFDWTNIDKFLKFDKLYIKLLNELKNLE